jgi:hypothetical protein
VTRFRDGSSALHPRFAANASLFEGQFTGICIGDYDRDGLEDLYFTNHGNPVTKPEFLAGRVPVEGSPTNELNPEGVGMPNALYRNTGEVDAGGTPVFRDVTETAGVGDLPGIGGGCILADFDNDGDLDLYVVNHLRGVTFAEFGFHHLMTGFEMNGFRDVGAFNFPPIFDWDTPEGQLNGEFVVLEDPSTGKPRGEGRNTLFRNLLEETGTARFVDVTDRAGDVGGTRGKFPGGRYSTTVTSADVNGDGLLDLFVANFIDQDFWITKARVDAHGQPAVDGENLRANAETNRLYLNRGGLWFEDVTEEAGVGTVEPFYYDYGGTRKDPYDAELRDVRGNPVGERATLTWGAAFNDFDQDGDPDLWVANDSPGTLNLFRNDTAEPGGAPRFTSIGRDSGVELIGQWMGFSFGDVDRDGDLDVFAPNFGGTDYYYTHNTDLSLRTLADDVGEWNRWQQNASLHGLFRNDGVRTIRRDGKHETVGTFPNIIQTVRLEQNRWMPMVLSDPTNVSPQKQPPLGMAPLEFAWGSLLFDYDNDTHVDLYTLGSLGRTFENPGRLLRNLGDLRFRDVSVEAHALDILDVDYERVDQGLPAAPGDRLEWDIKSKHNENGGAVASVDLDGNGFLDMIALNTGGFDSQHPDVPRYPGTGLRAFRPGPVLIFLNEGNGNHWLGVRLEGAMSSDRPEPSSGGANRDGIGSRVVAVVDGPEGPLTLVRELRAGGGFQAQDSPIVHFGLGEAERVRRLEVHWPWGGVDILDDVPAGQVVTVRQGSTSGRIAHQSVHQGLDQSRE